ncbi:MAG: glutathione S-transferase family protein [Proteobacteria bacterium]|nr:glutathione S-transferase family protein [Pseudomonadota bacterium]MBS0301139.1 glutathione S-transferase family protein [Pseudomonadota bacterium]
MKLYTAHRAPNPRRVLMFIHEKGMDGIERVSMDLNAGEHKAAAYRARNPVSTVPALELADGRLLSETRAICSYLEGLHPEPNLMGRDMEERAFIEMHDRRVEWYWLLPIANCVRHTHPGLAALEHPQFADFGRAQGERVRERARWLNDTLAQQEWMAGERFTIADITAFCAHEFARGLMKFDAGAEGFSHLQAWRDRVAARESARAV